MKVSRLFLIVVTLVFELFNPSIIMAQQASLTIRLGTFISVSCIPAHVYFSLGDAQAISVDSLAVRTTGPFEMLLIKARIDIGREVDSEGEGYKSFIFENRPAIPCDKGEKIISGQRQMTFPLQPETNTFVSITAL